MEEKVIKRLNRLKEKGVIKDYAIGGAHAVAYYLGSSRKSVGKLIRLTRCSMASNKEKKAFKGVKKSV